MSDDRQLTAGGRRPRTTTTTSCRLTSAEPIADPASHEHELRPTDVDEAAANRVERQISSMFLAAAVLVDRCSVVAYVTFDPQPDDGRDVHAVTALSNLTLGLCAGLARCC